MLLKQSGYDFLSGMPKPSFDRLRKLVIELVRGRGAVPLREEVAFCWFTVCSYTNLEWESMQDASRERAALAFP